VTGILKDKLDSQPALLDAADNTVAENENVLGPGY
jgi:hypothetical protein